MVVFLFYDKIILTMIKNIITVTLLLLSLILIVLIFDNKNSNADLISVAVCPTFYYMAEKLENIDNINIIKTGSTGESLQLLKNKKANFVISGRALKESEPDFLFNIIGSGYDFLFHKEIMIYDTDMHNIVFYTDINKEEIIQDLDNISIEQLRKVDDIDEYISQGIVITKLEGRLKGEVVHVFTKNGTRIRASRMPRLYYSSTANKSSVELIRDTFSQ